MIGRIRGTLIDKLPPFVTVEAAGVGYEMQVPMTTFYKLPDNGFDVVLHTHLSVSENAHSLFGFSELTERSLFRDLIKVNGVGPKLGLAILSGMEADEFVLAVRDGNSDQLVKLPGVGKKTADRLVIEMRDRLKDWVVDATRAASSEALPVADQDSVKEAVSALVALGYKPAIASKAISQVETPDANSSDLIRLALRQLAK